MSNNQLTSGIPTPLSALVNLESFNLSNNRLDGTIPTDLSPLVKLQTFNLSNKPVDPRHPDSFERPGHLAGP